MRSKILLSVVISSAIFLSGCSLFKRQVEIKTSYVEKPELTISNPKPLDLDENIEWVVITKDNYESVFKKLEESQTDVVLFGVTDEDYQSLSLNLQKIINYIQLQKDIIEAYKSYYKPSGDKE